MNDIIRLEQGDPGPQSPDDYWSTILPPSTKQQPADIELSEDTLSRHFCDLQRDRIKYDHTRDAWYIWRGTNWEIDETREVFDLIRNFCNSVAVSAKTEPEKRRLTSLKTCNAVESLSKVDRDIAVSKKMWDTDKYLMATPAGTLDLSTGNLQTSMPEDLITRCTSVSPAARSNCPLWREFLEDACAGDKEQVLFLQKMAGYSLTGDTREHALFFIFGPGGNGKSVFLNIIMSIMNTYALTAPIETFTASRGESHPTELAILDGARLVTASETEEGKRWAESRIKQLTGGDKISARFMRQDFFTFTPIFKLLIVGNHMPALSSVDDAARRRFRLVPFIHKPTAVDKQLESKLMKELPQIFRWAIEGCLLWQAEGLAPPSSVQETTENYFSEQDILQQWIDERCVTDPVAKCDSTLAFIDWSKFADDMGEYVGKKNTLTSKLKKKGIECKTGRIDGDLCRVYIGLRLKFGNSY